MSEEKSTADQLLPSEEDLEKLALSGACPKRRAAAIIKLRKDFDRLDENEKRLDRLIILYSLIFVVIFISMVAIIQVV